ncbi:MAG: GxxExxY protein [Acidobacteria bacterium]|nr:GxxExxY protein [Acidobacteriota bacterium]
MPQQTAHLNDPETYAIIGAAMAVHTELGCGFLEAVYKAALAIELRRRGMPFEREVALPIVYRGEPLPLSYRVDVICARAVIVEVKAAPGLSGIDHAQIINYLRASHLQRGLLLNFGARSLEYRRVVWGYSQGIPPDGAPADDVEPASGPQGRHRRWPQAKP